MYADSAAVPEEACAGLLAAGVQVSRTDGDEALLEALVHEAPTAVIVALRADLAADVALLTLLRRVGPAVPLILVGREGTIGDRQVLQRFHPHYYALQPCESGELLEAVLGQTRRRRSAGS